MQQHLLLKLLAALVLLCCAPFALAADDRQEPPISYTLTIDGQAHVVPEGVPTRLTGTFKDPMVALKPAATRTFAYGGVRFEYPATFNWEAEIEGPLEKTWTLSGNDFIIIYFIVPKKVTLDVLAQGMVKQFGAENTRIAKAQRQLGGKLYHGRRLAVTLAGTVQTMEIYSLPLHPKGMRTLMFQDTQPDNAKQSKEGTEALALFARSFSDSMSQE